MTKKIKCPSCGEKTTLENNQFRPFCSERCKSIDLGAWADGSYAVPGNSPGLEESEDLPEELKGKTTYH
ncbi:MAG: DNA gyrase inhibitor YacG [Proteobacteria bacterium]|nr:DNA gyrase inhibitor YacG [Pseudomonadota bacterium]